MLTSTATVTTPNASLYLKKLCKHFRHKVPAEWDDCQGIAHFPMGTGRFTATADALILHCEAESEDALGTVQWIIDDHLTRFSRQENLLAHWQTSNPGCNT